MRLPANRKQKYGNAPISTIDLEAIPEGQRLSPATINSQLLWMSGFIGWAINNGYYHAENPFKGLLVKDQVRPETKRHSFTDEQLQLLFSSPVYRGCIVHAVRKDVGAIRRADFKGREQREDAYGASVISIQMLREGGFISIKNRYNHLVSGCDNTFNSNPDNIIKGLSQSLSSYFNVAFSRSNACLPEGFVLMGCQLFKYNREANNIYYGDQAWAENGAVHEVDRSAGDALFGVFLFDNKTKTLENIDPELDDCFADDFNRDYGGNRGLCVRAGNLMLDGDVLIGASQSRIVTLDLAVLTVMGEYCLQFAANLTSFSAPALTVMGGSCLYQANSLASFSAPALTSMGKHCLYEVNRLTSFYAPALTSMERECLYQTNSLTSFSAPALTSMGRHCFSYVSELTSFSAPALTVMGNNCLQSVVNLTSFSAPALTVMGEGCIQYTEKLTSFSAPALTSMGRYSFYNVAGLTSFSAPALTSMGEDCFSCVRNLTSFSAPALASMGRRCLREANKLISFSAPALTVMGEGCLQYTSKLTSFYAPALTFRGVSPFEYARYRLLSLRAKAYSGVRKAAPNKPAR